MGRTSLAVTDWSRTKALYFMRMDSARVQETCTARRVVPSDCGLTPRSSTSVGRD